MKKKAIAVIITDTHLTDTNHDTNIAIYKQAIDLAKSLGLDNIEHGGDVFHSRKAQTQKNLDCIGEIFEMFEKEKMNLNIVVGNHDKTEYSLKNSFLGTYVYHPYINIFALGGGRPLVKDKIFLTYAPFFSDNEYVHNLKELQKNGGKLKQNVLLTHIGVSGAVMNNGMVIESAIDEKLFKGYDVTLIGHYHDAQQISSKIKYIGASLQHNFGERPVKGATVLYDDLTTEVSEFDFPRFLAYEIDAKDLSMKDIEDLKQTAKENGDKLRIILTGTKADVDGVDKQRLSIAGIDVKTKVDAIERGEVEESVIVFTDSGILDEFKTFCEKGKLIEVNGLKYLNQVIKHV